MEAAFFLAFARTCGCHRAAVVPDAGAISSLEPVRLLRADITEAGLTAAEAALELALCFHHAVQDEREKVTAAVSRLRDLARGGDYVYYVDVAQFMAGVPLDQASGARWLDSEQRTRDRWRGLVIARRACVDARR
ncbi:hypothetical protein QCN29_17845 [Streptomyces sp. HNM0663]|uniref:Uncharacterized protein n=1 Tax=Streptomyces chengmaiensis TaxID=3040919 RepID=A0ABT6HPK1_9ACTN|nr:hypothetical protein [Streptomyces chengmaiensis]MDH2390621.1 hypothetical protein [Streptomyces chengmaiensis]